MKFSKNWLFAVVLSFLLTGPLAAHAGEPTKQLSTTVNDFVAILNNTSVAELQATGLPENARKLVFARFDFVEMTMQTLGAHWKSLNPREQKEFVDAFTYRLLVSFGRTVRSDGGETIQFNREAQDGDQARVETKVVGGKGDDLPIDYRLHDVNGQWKVYDVSIDHVSLVSNYRAQFERVIAKSSVQQLLEKMKHQDS